jgi:hypothetical protein
MSCPTCDCKDWAPVPAAAGAFSTPPSLGSRLASRVRSLFGAPGADTGKRQCLRCGRVYSTRAADEDREEDLIAERMSRIESQMSGFSSSFMPDPAAQPDSAQPRGHVPSGMEMRPKVEMKCLRCGHFALQRPSPGAACPKCGRVYEKVEQVIRDKRIAELAEKRKRRKA